SGEIAPAHRKAKLLRERDGCAGIERELADEGFVAGSIGGERAAEWTALGALVHPQVAAGKADAEAIAERVRQGQSKIGPRAPDPVGIHLRPRPSEAAREPA